MTSKSRAAFLLVGERFIRLIVGFFIHAWMARSLSAESFGFINYVVKGVMIYYTFGLFGTDEVIMKEMIHKDPSSQKDVLKTTLIIRLMMGFLGWAIMSIISGFVSGFTSDTWFWMFIFGMTIPMQAFTLYEIPLQLDMKMNKIFHARNGSYFVGVIGKTLSLLLGAAKNIFVLVYAIEEFCWKFFATIMAFQAGFRGGKFSNKIAESILKPSFVAFIAAFLAMFDQRLPFLFLERLTDSITVGQYSIMVSLLDIAILIPIALATALFPSVVKGKSESELVYKEQRLQMSKWLLRFSLIISVVACLGSPLGMKILYKSKYNEIVPVFQIFVFSLVFYFFNIGRFKWFILDGALKDWVILLIVGIVVQSICLSIFIPLYKLNGVTISVLAGQILPNLILIWRRPVRESLVVLFQSFKI